MSEKFEKLIEQYSYDLKQLKIEYRKLWKKRKSMYQTSGLDSHGKSPWDMPRELEEVREKMKDLQVDIRLATKLVDALIKMKSL